MSETTSYMKAARMEISSADDDGGCDGDGDGDKGGSDGDFLR